MKYIIVISLIILTGCRPSGETTRSGLVKYEQDEAVCYRLPGEKVLSCVPKCK